MLRADWISDTLHTLRSTTRHCNAGCFAILIDTTSHNYCSDRIVISQSLLERLDNDHATAFATAISGATVIERERPSFVREKTGAISLDIKIGGPNYRDMDIDTQNSGSMFK